MDVDFSSRRHHRRPTLLSAGLGLVVLIAAGGLALYQQAKGGEKPQKPLERALSALVEDGPALRLLQLVGEPTCKARAGEEEVWLFAAEGERPGCAPARGDLVVHIGFEQRIRAIVPQYELYAEVRSRQDWERFHRMFGGQRAPVPQQPEP